MSVHLHYENDSDSRRQSVGDDGVQLGEMSSSPNDREVTQAPQDDEESRYTPQERRFDNQRQYSVASSIGACSRCSDAPLVPAVTKPADNKKSPPVHEPHVAFHFNSSASVSKYIIESSHFRTTQPIWYQMHLSILGGLMVMLGGCFSITSAGGIAAATRTAYPMFPALAAGLTFPVAMLLILTYGGELFTGNTMHMAQSLYHRKITWGGLARNWLISYVGNFLGCFLGAALIWKSHLYDAEPFLSYVQAIAVKKTSMLWGAAFIRAIFANMLVCICIHTAFQARDFTGRVLATWASIGTFATIGFEHCIANMFNIITSLLYGSTATVRDCVVWNFIPVTLGNIVGGALVVGLSTALLHTPPELRYDWMASDDAAAQKVTVEASSAEPSVVAPVKKVDSIV